MLGAMVSVLVAVKLPAEVTLKYIARAGSETPSATVVVASASEPKDCSVAYPRASPISSRLVFVLVPHVPDSSPVEISFNLRSLT